MDSSLPGGRTLVETLDPPHFRKAHLPGAINIPTDQIAHDAPRQLDPDDTIVVYCANTECSASPRAAEELARMGYKRVIDFEAGKKGWEEVKAGFETTYNETREAFDDARAWLSEKIAPDQS